MFATLDGRRIRNYTIEKAACKPQRHNAWETLQTRSSAIVPFRQMRGEEMKRILAVVSGCVGEILAKRSFMAWRGVIGSI